MRTKTHCPCFAAVRLLCLSILPVGCAHTPDTTTEDPTPSLRIEKKTSFLDYLPKSAVKEKFSCTLEPGEYALFAPALPIDRSEWVFVNFKQQPKKCDFWQGFVQANALGDEIQQGKSETTKEMSDSPAKPHQSGGIATRLLATYGTAAGYGEIEQSVLGWYGEKREGCVAFASTALRSIGETVPLTALKGDDAISIVTKPFVEYLGDALGYERINDLEKAQPGDIGVTADDARAPGYPTHVYVFAQWESKADKIARVIDNQGFKHLRPINRSTDPRFADKDPTAYFLRPRR